MPDSERSGEPERLRLGVPVEGVLLVLVLLVFLGRAGLGVEALTEGMVRVGFLAAASLVAASFAASSSFLRFSSSTRSSSLRMASSSESSSELWVLLAFVFQWSAGVLTDGP